MTLCLFASPAVAQVGLGLSPLRMELAAVPGKTITDALAISNESDSPVRVRASTLDFWIDDKQDPQFGSDNPELTASTCRHWLRLNPGEFLLAPHEQKLVRYSFRFPDVLSEGSYHCAAAFTTAPAAAVGSLGMVTNVRLITAFYTVSGKPQPEMQVRGLRFIAVDDVPDVKRQAVLSIENTGSTYFRVIGNLEVVEANGATSEIAPFRPIPVLPHRSQQFLFPLKSDFQLGQTIRARIDIGNGEIQEMHVPAVPASSPAQ